MATYLRLTPAAALAGIACLVGGASILAGGALPGDVAVTRGLQAILGAKPDWATFLTQTAKAPLLWGAVALAALMAGVRGWVAGALAVPLAYGLALLADLALRAVIHVPKPDAALVAVASASSASGLPSTFALVYASIFGVVVWQRATTPVLAGLGWLAGALILIGCSARIVLGGHWTSQMLASAALGLVLAFAATWAVARGWDRLQSSRPS
jgi:membrane-associated phospholipid phosphatase